MGEFLTATLKIVTILGLDGILNSTGDWIVDTENGALHKLDLPGSIASQVVSRGSLSLAPGLGGRSLRARVRGGDSAGHTKAGGGVVVWIRLAEGLGVCGVGFSQAVAGGRSLDGRGAALVVKRVIKGAAVGALVLLEERLRGIAVLGEIVLLQQEDKCLVRVKQNKSREVDGQTYAASGWEIVHAMGVAIAARRRWAVALARTRIGHDVAKMDITIKMANEDGG